MSFSHANIILLWCMLECELFELEAYLAKRISTVEWGNWGGGNSQKKSYHVLNTPLVCGMWGVIQ